VLTPAAACARACAQVTSDGVPVLWHDDQLELIEPYDRNNGNDAAQPDQTVRRAAVKDLSLKQFKSVVQLGATTATGTSTALVRHFRGAASRDYLPDARVLPWACEQEDALPTLAEVFAAVPTYCGFNIEIKVRRPAYCAVPCRTAPSTAPPHPTITTTNTLACQHHN
jgi:glycerophosphoryl diester phosphodiesterase